jgi:hypothetical protein
MSIILFIAIVVLFTIEFMSDANNKTLGGCDNYESYDRFKY